MIEYIIKAYHDHKGHIPNILWQVLYAVGKQIFILGVFVMGIFLLNPYDFGLYNYVTAILLLFVLFGDFGISMAASKFVAHYRALDHEREGAVLWNATLFALLFIVLSGGVLSLFAPRLFGENARYLYILFPSLLFLPLGYLYAGIYRGVGRFKATAWITFFVGIFSLAITFFLMRAYGLHGALWGNNIFSFLLFVSLALGYRNWSWKLDVGLMKTIGSYSLILGFTGLSYYLYSRVDIILLGKFNYIAEIGFYELINKVFMILAAPFMILAQAIAPMVSGMHARGEFKAVLHTYKQLMFLSVVGALLLTIGTYFFAPIVLKSGFPHYANPMFINAIYISLIMLIGQSLSTVTAIGFSVSTGHANINMYFLLICGVINIPLTYFFIKAFGFMGAIYATVIIRCLTDILFITYYYFVLKRKAVYLFGGK